MSYYKSALSAVTWCAKQWPNNHELVLSITNSVNENQMLCKKWLVDELKDILDSDNETVKNPKILVIAGWFGLVGEMCRTRLKAEVTVMDRDVLCEPVGRKMYPDIKHKWGNVETWDMFEYDIIICTSCEHISDKVLKEFLLKKDENTLVVLQSNDYFSVEEHINCKRSLRDFANSQKLQIIKETELKVDGYTRFMIFGL